MTSQLLILGNGFDLHCGLRSSYKDFFRSEILDTTVISFGLRQLQAGTSGFWEALLLEHYINNNIDDYNWCDFEAIIKNTLLQLFVKLYKNSRGLLSYAWESIKNNINPNNTELKFDNIEEYILSCCMNFIKNSRVRYKDFDYTSNFFIQVLFQELNNLEKRFCKYLKNQIINPKNKNEKNENYITNAVKLLARIAGFEPHYEINAIDDIEKNLINIYENLNNVFILNFNYTALFDILDVESPCYYNNVHGKLCNEQCTQDCNLSTVIFGIDDNLIQSQDTHSQLRLFSKTYRKMFTDGDPVVVLPPNDGSEIEIKFYGHSLSEADYSYFQSIFDYYNLYSNNNVNLNFYHSKGYGQHDAIYKLISEYGKTLPNKAQGKNLIHKLLLENRLKIIEIE